MTATVNELLDRYRHSNNLALMRFQFIEEILKMYLASAYAIIHQHTAGVIPFKYSYKDVKTEPLGHLLRTFKKLNDNAGLIADLAGIIKDRNHCAHQSYLMTVQEQNDPAYLKAALDEMESIAHKADVCLQALMKEMKGIEAARKAKNV